MSVYTPEVAWLELKKVLGAKIFECYSKDHYLEATADG